MLCSQLERSASSIFRVQHSCLTEGRPPPCVVHIHDSSDLLCTNAQKVSHCFQGSSLFIFIFVSAKDALMNHVRGFSYHISNSKSFDKCLLSQNPSIGVNNVLSHFGISTLFSSS